MAEKQATILKMAVEAVKHTAKYIDDIEFYAEDSGRADRAFLYEILKRITEIREQVDRCLSGLERYDLIRTRAIEPELEYVFKHALTQEVVYNGLLKKERQEIEKLYRRGPNNRVRKRAQAIRLSAMGYTVTQIAEILGCNRQSIHNWFDLFEAQGCQGFNKSLWPHADNLPILFP